MFGSEDSDSALLITTGLRLQLDKDGLVLGLGLEIDGLDLGRDCCLTCYRSEK